MRKETSVYHLISSLSRGGRERQLAILYKYTKNTNTKIKIICFNRSNNSYLEEYEMSDDVIFLTSGTPFRRYMEIKKILNKSNADVVWTWGGLEASMGLLLSIFTRVGHINGSVRHGIIKFRASHLWRMIVLHLSKYRVANSISGLKANYLKRGFVWYNGLDDVFFTRPLSESKKEELKESLAMEKDCTVLISVANLVPYKDYFTVIKVLKRLKDQGIEFYYLVVGEGRLRDAIKTAIDDSGLHSEIKLLGRRKDVKELLQLSNIFIHSSIGEGCSNAILEAMAAGKPVIATDVGGTSEIVDSSNSFLFAYKDQIQLETHLMKLLTDRDSRLVMGKNSFSIASQRFSSNQMIKRYNEILECVSQKKTG